LNDIVGQDHVTKLLASAVKQDSVAHAYLFTGPRGVGKTSIARILAHEVNGLPYSDESTHLDIIEIDAASNNGVEDIRDLRERVQIAPVSAKRKVYIIDEVHMLSKAAFNALLKTLEEPPEHVMFILATTDIDKVPETINSRTQRHSFRRASEVDIITNLKRIVKKEDKSVDEAALQLIAKHSDGSFRDSVSLLDQLLSGADGNSIDSTHVIASLGLVPTDTIEHLVELTEAGDIAAINQTLSDLESQGVPPRTTAAQLTDYLRRRMAENVGYARLLNDLLDVSKSQYPELKLLTVLSLHAEPSNLPTPPVAPEPVAPEPKEPVEPTPTVRDKPKKAPAKAAPKSTKKESKAPAGPFDWSALLAHVRTHHVALHSVLSKCDPEADGGKLHLYTKSAFYKKKLDDPKYRALLNDSLSELGYTFDIETVATAKPHSDSQAARIAAMMGGGEEVSVD
jgi:DNA polymerase-3 subunit gamma/tau